MGSIQTAIKGASTVQDADTAKVFAEILNNDLLAIQTLGGRGRFDTDDALRIGRILNEYQGMMTGADAKPIGWSTPKAGILNNSPVRPAPGIADKVVG